MNQLEQFSELPYSHHAYGIESSYDIIKQLKETIPSEDCSYIFDKQYDNFKIGDARTIKALQSEKTEKAAIFILSFTVINSEAQNALLKVLEEPTPNTYFILIFPDAKNLLPTLQSRLLFVRYRDEGADVDVVRRIILSDFLGMNLQQRFDLIKQLTDKKSSDPLHKSDLLRFLNDCEVYLHKKKDLRLESMETLFRARTYFRAKGSSHKMILEMVAIHL